MLFLGSHWPLPFDVYLLRFREGAEIPPHTDKVESGKHFRLNLIIKQAKSGGEFVCKEPLYENAFIKYFRSDLCEHSVTKVEQGNRYVLSIGWVTDS